jgi:hypothetical protein
VADETRTGNEAAQDQGQPATANEGAEVNVNAEDGATVNVGEPQGGAAEEGN